MDKTHRRSDNQRATGTEAPFFLVAMTSNKRETQNLATIAKSTYHVELIYKFSSWQALLSLVAKLLSPCHWPPEHCEEEEDQLSLGTTRKC
jgi:hypothetical protein